MARKFDVFVKSTCNSARKPIRIKGSRSKGWRRLGSSVTIKQWIEENVSIRKIFPPVDWSFSLVKFNDHSWITSSFNSYTIILVTVFVCLFTTPKSRMMQSNILWLYNSFCLATPTHFDKETLYFHCNGTYRTIQRRCVVMSASNTAWGEQTFWNNLWDVSFILRLKRSKNANILNMEVIWEQNYLKDVCLPQAESCTLIQASNKI